MAPEPLTAEEMEVLVARIALYPDELVAVIASSALYPLQVVQAARYLDKVKTKPDLKPDANWDGSVISLMNYPEIVTMMSDDLDWTPPGFGGRVYFPTADGRGFYTLQVMPKPQTNQ